MLQKDKKINEDQSSDSIVLNEKWKYLQYETKSEARNAREEHFKNTPTPNNPCRHLVGNKLAYIGTFHGTLPRKNKNLSPQIYDSYIPFIDSIVEKQPIKFKSLFENIMKKKATLYIEGMKQILHKKLFTNITEGNMDSPPDDSSVFKSDPDGTDKKQKTMNAPKVKKAPDTSKISSDDSDIG